MKPKAALAAVSTEPQVTITAPNFRFAEITIRGLAPYVQSKFSTRAIQSIVKTQSEGTQAVSKRKRPPKDFDAVCEGARYRMADGSSGVPCGAFRAAMIDSCRLVGFRMTHAKLAVFVEPDGFDVDDRTPLVKIRGEWHRWDGKGRNANGSTDIHPRPMWDSWEVDLRIKYDADQFSADDIVNLIHRAGQQVGIGDGRPNSRMCYGMGFGVFSIVQKGE